MGISLYIFPRLLEFLNYCSNVMYVGIKGILLYCGMKSMELNSGMSE